MTPYERRNKPDRDAWRLDVPERCMWCGDGLSTVYGLNWFEIHEMLPRGRCTRWSFRANFLLVHNVCHSKAAESSAAAQLARKKHFDADHYDLHEWLKRRDARAMEYVTESEVDAELRRFLEPWRLA